MVIAERLIVPQLEPRLKHPTIFQHFDSLEGGESFIIENDHDPKPLYYQLLGQRGPIFTWEYLQQGPDWFIIKIAKNAVEKTNEETETVGSIVAKDIRKADVFKAKGIDFCCGGDKTLKEASEEAGINEQELRDALANAGSASVSPSVDYNKWDLDFLADYIVNTHHRYIKENAEVIYGLAVKVAQHHGENHPELNKFAESVHSFLQDLLNHAQKEEKILFPAIKNGVAKKKDPSFSTPTPPGFIRQPVTMMMKEHDMSGEELTYFRKLTNNYALPADACNSYNYLFEKMKEFEDDLHTHIHLENNILFPKALKLDAALAEA